MPFKLTRKEGEAVYVGEACVRIVGVTGPGRLKGRPVTVRMVIDAPPDVKILKQEKRNQKPE